MWALIYPVLFIVISNVLYNICTKSTPENAHPFASLTITYSVAALASLIMFFVSSKNKNIFTELGKTNWSSFALGVVIIGLELGYILAYRNGWQMNRVSLTANIVLAIILVFVAAIGYRETITARQIIGIIVCCGGLVLISI